MKVYFAGKIDRHDWRTTLTDNKVGDVGIYQHPPYSIRIMEGVEYVGPWYIACDHGCYHGTNNHGVGASTEGCGSCVDNRLGKLGRSGAHKLCLDCIKECDVLFAWIDTSDCYGTISEIGYAAALDKKIWLVYDTTFLADIAKKGIIADFDVKDGGIVTKPLSGPYPALENLAHDMWFLDHYADVVTVSRQRSPVTEFKRLYENWMDEGVTCKK